MIYIIDHNDSFTYNVVHQFSLYDEVECDNYNAINESKLKKSSVIILICMQRDLNESIPEWEEIASVSMSVQNMWLMATDLKIGAYWSSTKFINCIDEFIPLDKGESCLGIFYMGKYDDQTLFRSPRPIDEKVKWFK